MYRRFVILSVVILMALGVLAGVGYQSVQIRRQGAEGRRMGEFAEVAEQVRQDVKRKLDAFLRQEQNRPYADYQYYYVPENIAGNVDIANNAIVQNNQAMPLLRSPLAGAMRNEYGYGSFQIGADGAITTPYYNSSQALRFDGAQELSREADAHVINVKQNLLPAISVGREIVPPAPQSPKPRQVADDMAPATQQVQVGKAAQSKAGTQRRAEYQVVQEQQTAQVYRQQRNVAELNVTQAEEKKDLSLSSRSRQDSYTEADGQEQMAFDMKTPLAAAEGAAVLPAEDTVQVRIEPFVPVVVGGDDNESMFGGQVFFLRHVQVEDKHFLQGFKLDEDRLITEVGESASRFVRKGMGFEIARTENGGSAYTAILNFGFGDLVLNLLELDPMWLSKQLSNLRNWYFSIIGVVCLATVVALGSLWRNLRAQVKLAQKKDDFISAVSHELRTPLTSIRMYSEMLEKNWVKSPDKAAEYYTNMRQESERLSRLVENVLDFSRIQKGRKKYNFVAGDINACIGSVIDMMTVYAAQHGFTIKRDFGIIGQAAFDSDAVAQITVNLLDNAVKYARNAADKTITVRTWSDGQFVYIEVEDHGPGIPHSQRKKVFEEFYRIGSEATRETAGTGLGLALVEKFAEAHNGFVRILAADPTGAIFRIALPLQAG